MRTQWTPQPKGRWSAESDQSPTPHLLQQVDPDEARPSHRVSRELLSKRQTPQGRAVSRSHSHRYGFIARLQKCWVVSHKTSTLQDFMTLFNAYFYHLTTTLIQHPAYSWSFRDRANLPSCRLATLTTFFSRCSDLQRQV